MNEDFDKEVRIDMNASLMRVSYNFFNINFHSITKGENIIHKNMTIPPKNTPL